MTVWRDVEEALYARWTALWVDGDDAPRTPTQFENEDPADMPAGPWAKVIVQSRPGGAGTINPPGRRKMDRRGVVFVLLRGPKGQGVGPLSDLAELARNVFENCRVATHGLRFATADIGEAALVLDERYWGVTVEAPFDYEETK